MILKVYQNILKKPLLYLLVFGIAFRLIIYTSYNAITIYPDSRGYIKLSKFILNLSFENYTGERTPGFPMLIAVSGGDLYITVFLQLVLGLLSIILLFNFIKIKSKSTPVAFWSTLIYSSFLHIVLFEFAILTETLTTFLVILTFWLIEKYKIFNHDSKVIPVLILSIILSLLYLTRPMFIYFPVGFSLFYLVKNYRWNLKLVLIKILIILTLPYLSYYAWCSVNKNNIGVFASTYFTGVNLAQMATPFFEKAPEEDKLIRDILVKHRELNPMSNSKRKHPMSVWFAWNELQQNTKLLSPQLSHELGRISKNLILKHPDLYFKQVFVSWSLFWDSSIFFWKAENIKNDFIKTWTYRLWYSFQKHLLLLINLLFLVFSIKKLSLFFLSKSKKMDTDLLIVAIVISGSLAQALIAYGSNSRFCVPFFPLIVYFVFKKHNFFSRKL
ncbi:hypothetical protein [Xanthomarina gelatinilytica]|uniref:hypothetical protein n=1 Tax=Xanthomarina gelatinilytica TaxID=1137281 RepID=UPI003AA870A7